MDGLKRSKPSTTPIPRCANGTSCASNGCAPSPRPCCTRSSRRPDRRRYPAAGDAGPTVPDPKAAREKYTEASNAIQSIDRLLLDKKFQDASNAYGAGVKAHSDGLKAMKQALARVTASPDKCRRRRMAAKFLIA